eukprot:1729442-Pleurochrysis_carterae.AAC.2
MPRTWIYAHGSAARHGVISWWYPAKTSFAQKRRCIKRKCAKRDLNLKVGSCKAAKCSGGPRARNAVAVHEGDTRRRGRCCEQPAGSGRMKIRTLRGRRRQGSAVHA